MSEVISPLLDDDPGPTFDQGRLAGLLRDAGIRTQSGEFRTHIVPKNMQRVSGLLARCGFDLIGHEIEAMSARLKNYRDQSEFGLLPYARRAAGITLTMPQQVQKLPLFLDVDGRESVVTIARHGYGERGSHTDEHGRQLLDEMYGVHAAAVMACTSLEKTVSGRSLRWDQVPSSALSALLYTEFRTSRG